MKKQLLIITYTIISCCFVYIFSNISNLPANASQLDKNLIKKQNQMAIVNNRNDILRLQGQRVKLLSRYVSNSITPLASGIPGRTIPHLRANIVLSDGTKVAIFPSWDKKSLRSPEEVENYEQQYVEVTGIVRLEGNTNRNRDKQEVYILLESLQIAEKI